MRRTKARLPDPRAAIQCVFSGLWLRLASQRGQALVLVMGFMVLSLPLVTGALGFAGTALIDSRVKTDLLKSQYASLGGQELALQILTSTSTPATTTTGTIEINGRTITYTIRRVDPPASYLGLSSLFSNFNLDVTKEADVSTASGNDTINYTVTFANRDTAPLEIKNLHDILPKDFTYVDDSATFPTTSANIIDDSTQLTESSGSWIDKFSERLIWDIPDTTLQPGDNAYLTVQATVDGGVSSGVYCNEAYTQTGWFFRKTTSGKTAKITVGGANPTDPCEGRIYTVTKTVDPDVAPGDTLTTYTYTVTITNDGTDDVQIWKVVDAFSDGLTFVNFNGSTFVSSTPFDFGAPTEDYVADTLEWQIGNFFSGKLLSPGETFVLQFKMQGTLPRGAYPNEVQLTFAFFEFVWCCDFEWTYLPPDTTWPTAPINVFDYYEITVTDGITTSTCYVWAGADLEGNDAYLLEDCLLGIL